MRKLSINYILTHIYVCVYIKDPSKKKRQAGEGMDRTIEKGIVNLTPLVGAVIARITALIDKKQRT